MAQPSAVEPRKTFSVLTPILFGIWQTNPCWADGCRTSISVCTQIGLDEDLWLNLRRSNHGKHSRSLHPFSLGYGKRIHAGRMDVGPASRCVLPLHRKISAGLRPGRSVGPGDQLPK